MEFGLGDAAIFMPIHLSGADGATEQTSSGDPVFTEANLASCRYPEMRLCSGLV